MSAGQATPATLWGFHRLTPEWADRIVAAAAVRPGELVVDVGAGTGALTLPLLAAGARVIAIEKHRGRADRLRSELADQGADRVSVLTLDLQDFRWPRRPVRVVANPPFALLPQLIAALRRHRELTAADLVMPRSAVRRHVSRGGTRQLRPQPGPTLPRSAFEPRPPLDCAVLQLRKTRPKPVDDSGASLVDSTGPAVSSGRRVRRSGDAAVSRVSATSRSPTRGPHSP